MSLVEILQFLFVLEAFPFLLKGKKILLGQEKVVEAGGLDQIVICLGRGPDISRAAIELLFELLHDGSRWNKSTCKKLKQQKSSILFLVMLLNNEVRESAEKSEVILWKLCEDDDDTILSAAASSWYKPLIDRLSHGKSLNIQPL